MYKTRFEQKDNNKFCLPYDDRYIIIDKYVNYEDFKILIKQGYGFLFDYTTPTKEEKRPTIFKKDIEKWITINNRAHNLMNLGRYYKLTLNNLQNLYDTYYNIQSFSKYNLKNPDLIKIKKK